MGYRRAGPQGVALVAVAADEHLVVGHLAHADVELALLRKDHRRGSQTVGAEGGDHDPLGLGVQDGPARRQRIGRRAGGGGDDDPVAPEMLDQNVVAVDAEVDGLLQPPLGHHDVVEGVALPAVVPQNADVEQHPAVQAVLPAGHGAQLCLQFVHLAGGQKAAPPQVDPQNGLVIVEGHVGDVQDGAVPADGQDDVGLFHGLVKGQVVHPCNVAALLPALVHQDGRAVAAQNLRRPQSQLPGRALAGVGGNIDCHLPAPPGFDGFSGRAPDGWPPPRRPPLPRPG